jgi:transposase-like protein
VENVLTEAMDILKRLPEGGVGKALEALRQIKEECDREKRTVVRPCPHCGGGDVVRNGHKHGKQAYRCRSCGKSFVETTKTVLFNSHSGEAVWRQVIRDTVSGVPIDETAGNLGLHHETVFNMRHKILYCLEQKEHSNPTRLEGVCEADETYLLESLKGVKLPPDFWRKPRKHGAKAEKRGLSNEYICVCAGVEREGNAISVAVNRATAG